MASLFTSGKFQAFDAAGNPLAGGKVWTYSAGTSTLKATYTTLAGDVANSNPVILNSAGQAHIWLGTGSYKIVVTDADGVAAPDGTVDGISDPSIEIAADLAGTEAGQGAHMVGYLDASLAETTVHAALRSIESSVTSFPGALDAAVAEAEAARDAAIVAANVFADTVTGLAGTSSSGATNRYFSVPSGADYEGFILYRNDAGVATEINRFPSFGFSVNMHRRLEDRTVETAWIGQEATTSAAAAIPQGNWIFGSAIAVSGWLVSVKLYAMATGSLKLRAFSKAGDDFTETRSVTVAVVATGNVTLTAEDIGPFELVAGEYLGCYSDGTVIGFTGGASAGATGAWYGVSGVDDATITDASLSTTGLFHFGFEVPSRFVSGDILTRIDTAESSIATLQGALYTAQVIGAETPATGLNASAATYVLNAAAAGAGTVGDVTIYSNVASVLEFSVYTRSGSTFTRTGSVVTETSAIGSNVFTLSLPIAAGEYLGVTVGTTGGLTYLNPSVDAYGWFSGTLSSNAFTDATATTSAPLQIRFDLLVASQQSSTWAGKRLAFFGDSITDSGTWHVTLCESIGAVMVIDDARGGTMMLDALDNMVSDSFTNVDVAVIFYGTNDYHNATTLGAITDATSALTFYGHTKKVIDQFITWKPTLRVVLMTPLQRTLAAGTGGGPTLLEYVDAVKEVAGFYACPVLDLYRTSGLNAVNAATLTTDGLHPTTDAQTTHIANVAVAFFNGINP